MVIHICDWCKRKLDSNCDKFWDSGISYDVLIGDAKRIKINKQSVVLKIRIALECGNPLEICNKCATKIIKKYYKL
jgi:hypothetical protein